MYLLERIKSMSRIIKSIAKSITLVTLAIIIALVIRVVCNLAIGLIGVYPCLIIVILIMIITASAMFYKDSNR
jgi:hypothetical protein